MSVITEAKIRRLYKDSLICDGGQFQLQAGEKLTPSARGFLNDHHIRVVHSNSSQHSTVSSHPISKGPVTHFEDSAIFPIIFRLTRLYPHFLKAQRDLYSSFEQVKCDKIGALLGIIERMAHQELKDDLKAYDSELLSNIELDNEAKGVFDSYEKVALGYTVTDWKLSVYQSYLEVAILSKEYRLLNGVERDPFQQKLLHLLDEVGLVLWNMLEE